MAFTRVLGPGIHTASNINSHNINSTGIITAVSFVGDGSGLTGVASTDNIITGTAATFNTYPVDINAGMDVVGVSSFQDIDVDGHTNLDNVSIVGVTTTNGDVHIGSGDLRFENSAHKIYTASSAHTLTIQGGASNPGGKIEFRGGTSDNDIRFFTSDGSGNSVEKLRIASNGNISITKDLDVDGHTNLDNLSVAGVSTFAGTLNASTVSSTAFIASGDLDVDGHTKKITNW